MAKSTLAFFGFLSVLLLSLTIVTAAVSQNNVSITLDQTSLSDVSVGETYTIKATIENLNDTAFYVSFRATGWDSWDSDANVAAGESEDFTGVFTIPASTPASRGVYVDIYNASNTTQKLFDISRSISLSYANITQDPIQGCTDPTANNYNSDATEDDNSCTYAQTGDTYCDEFGGEKGTLEIKNFYIDYNGNGDDEEWEALDEILIEVGVKNVDSDDRVDDIIVEIKILDSSDNDVTADFEFEDEEITLGRISKKSTETAIFTIKELPTDVEEDAYTIYVRAYDEENEADQCVSKSSDFNDDDETSHEFEVVREDEAVIIKNSDLIGGTILASCGDENIQVSFPVYNLGDEEEDKVLVQLHNSELSINEFYVIDSLRSGKGKETTFFIDLPEELSKPRYSLDIYTFFAYDEDDDELIRTSYDENSNDIDRDFSIRLEVLSCQGPAPTIDASLISDATLEEELIVKATIMNNGADNNFIISPAGFESWAELVSVTPQTAAINEGESTEVMIKFIPTKEGIQSFKINTIVDGETHEQTVSVNISEKQSAFGGINNTLLYIIVAIIIVLIIIFLVLIIKVSQRQTKPQF